MGSSIRSTLKLLGLGDIGRMGARFLGGGFIGSEDARVFGNYMEHQGQGGPPVKGGHRLFFSGGGGGAWGGSGLHSVGMADATWLSSLHSLPQIGMKHFGRFGRGGTFSVWEEISSEAEHLTSEGKELLCSLAFEVWGL